LANRKFSVCILSLIAVAFAEHEVAMDPIDEIGQKLNSDKTGLWVNGVFPAINLPADVKADTVIKEAITKVGFDKGYIKTFKIVEVRQLRLDALGMQNCSAALIETDLGTKVLLFKYDKNSSWWTRFFDIPIQNTHQAALAVETGSNDIFKSVIRKNDLLIVTFQDQGLRYLMQLNGEELGINRYKQTLCLNAGDTLTLTHKHGYFTITPAFEKKIAGLNVNLFSIDGERKNGQTLFIEAK
jgi:hypothetical protein